MKQQVQPVVIVIAIVLVLAIVVGIGYFAVLRPKSQAGKPMPEEATQKMEQTRQEGMTRAAEQRARSRQRGPGGGPPRGR